VSRPAATSRVRRLGLGSDPDPLFADLIAAVAAAAEELGIEPVVVAPGIPSDGLDRILLVGRPGRYRELLADPGGCPTTVWTGEPLPTARASSTAVAPRTPAERSRRARQVARSAGGVLRTLPLPPALDRRRVGLTTDRLTRANLDELVAASAHGADLVVTSRDRAASLAGWGLTARAVPFGYHERHAGPLTSPEDGVRDNRLLLLGSRAAHTRRAAAVDRLRRDGAAHGLRIEERMWGEERAALLRRTRVMVDVHRVPGNFVGLRLLLSLAAGVALVTEPMTDPAPFRSGVHYVEAPVESLLAVATALADDAPRRAALVEAGQALLRGELAMRRSLERVLSGGFAA
jgi:hypothetical protein